MIETVQIDRAGRLVLPKRLRERFRLEGGDTLAVEAAIELRPTKAAARLKRVNEVLVLAGGGHLPAGRDFVAEEARLLSIRFVNIDRLPLVPLIIVNCQ